MSASPVAIEQARRILDAAARRLLAEQLLAEQLHAVDGARLCDNSRRRTTAKRSKTTQEPTSPASEGVG